MEKNKRKSNRLVKEMVKVKCYCLIFVLLSTSCNMDYHEPTQEEINYSLNYFNNVAFRCKVIGFDNMGLAVKRHRLISTKIIDLSKKIENNNLGYCYQYFEKDSLLIFKFTNEAISYNSHISTGYILEKHENTDTVKAYDTEGIFVKEFVLFE